MWSCSWSMTRTHPIEAGRLPNGDPDLYFRGFYYWNNEVGSKTLGIASFYLRVVCMNQNLWGIEDFQQISIRHSKFAAKRFAHEAAPALTRFANSSPAPFIAGIRAARDPIIAHAYVIGRYGKGEMKCQPDQIGGQSQSLHP